MLYRVISELRETEAGIAAISALTMEQAMRAIEASMADSALGSVRPEIAD